MAVLLGSSAAIAQRVQVTADTRLRLEPQFESAMVAAVRKGDSGTVEAKQGPWLLFKGQGYRGWLLTTNVVFDATSAAESPSRFVSRQGATSTSTIGIRCHHCHTWTVTETGINEQQLMLLDHYATSKHDAEHLHARPTGLQAQNIPLP